jgi:hypothetical protein
MERWARTHWEGASFLFAWKSVPTRDGASPLCREVCSIRGGFICLSGGVALFIDELVLSEELLLSIVQVGSLLWKFSWGFSYLFRWVCSHSGCRNEGYHCRWVDSILSCWERQFLVQRWNFSFWRTQFSPCYIESDLSAEEPIISKDKLCLSDGWAISL